MKQKSYVFLMSFLILCVGLLCVWRNNEEVDLVKVNAETLSNEKIAWGIKRAENHEQPDLGSKNKQLIDQYEGIAMGNNEKPYVYLTFDEGYEAGYTSQILDTLKENRGNSYVFYYCSLF